MGKYDDIVECSIWSNGEKYYRVKLQGHLIGSYRHVDNGFLVSGKRKPVPTEEAAIRQILVKRLQELDKEERALTALSARQEQEL